MVGKLKRKLCAYRRDPKSFVLFLSVCLAALITMLALIFIIAYILIKGIPNLTPDLFDSKYTTENVSLLPALINTLFIMLLSLLFAVPVGIISRIYLTNSGSLFFVKYLGLGLSLLSGALTLSIMILPLIMRTTEEALRSVPDSYREGSFGLGAGKLRTVFSIVLPCAVPGILSGIILGIGRIVGESAALIFTAGTVAEIATSIFSVHMYSISGEGLYIKQTYATAVVLLVVVILINGLSGFVAKKIGGKNADG